MAARNEAGLYMAVQADTVRTDDGTRRERGDTKIRGVDGEEVSGSHSRMTASRRETEAYLADARNVRGRKHREGGAASVSLDYKAIKKEAKTEYRKIKEGASRVYERRLEDAQMEFLRHAARSRREYRDARERAREEMRQLLQDAREQYEFTLDMARDMRPGTKRRISGGFGKADREALNVGAGMGREQSWADEDQAVW